MTSLIEDTQDGVATPVQTAAEQRRMPWVRRLRLRPWECAIAGVVLLGFSTRVLPWLAGRKFGNDEIAVLYSIKYMSPLRLLGPLYLAQGGPVLWILGEKTTGAVFGYGEVAMRFLPMLCACLSVLFTARLAYRMLTGPAAAVATLLIAVAPLPAMYAWQVKPYSAEMTVTAVLLLAALSLARSSTWTWRHGMRWWILAAVAAGFSFPGILLAGALSAVLVADRVIIRRGVVGRSGGGPATGRPGREIVRRARHECLAFAAPAPLWLLAVASTYFFKLRFLKGNQDGSLYWASGFGPRGQGVWSYVQWFWDVLLAMLGSVFTSPVTWPALIVAGAGVAVLWRRDRIAGALLVTPPVVALLIAAANAYPFKQRLALWTVPAVVVLLAAPLVAASPSTGNRVTSTHVGNRAGGSRIAGKPIAVAGITLLLLLSVAVPAIDYTRTQVAHPASRDLADAGGYDDAGPALAIVREQMQPGDRVVTQDSMYHRSNWYGLDRGLKLEGMLWLAAGTNCDDTAIRDMIGDSKRVWLITGTLWLRSKPPFETIAVSWLRTRGHVTEVARHARVGLFLADLTMPPDTPADRAGASTSSGYCLRYLDAPDGWVQPKSPTVDHLLHRLFS